MALAGMRKERPKCTDGNSPEWTFRYTVILETRSACATSSTVSSSTPWNTLFTASEGFGLWLGFRWCGCDDSALMMSPDSLALSVWPIAYV